MPKTKYTATFSILPLGANVVTRSTDREYAAAYAVIYDWTRPPFNYADGTPAATSGTSKDIGFARTRELAEKAARSQVNQIAKWKRATATNIRTEVVEAVA